MHKGLVGYVSRTIHVISELLTVELARKTRSTTFLRSSWWHQHLVGAVGAGLKPAPTNDHFHGLGWAKGSCATATKEIIDRPVEAEIKGGHGPP